MPGYLFSIHPIETGLAVDRAYRSLSEPGQRPRLVWGHATALLGSRQAKTVAAERRVNGTERWSTGVWWLLKSGRGFGQVAWVEVGATHWFRWWADPGGAHHDWRDSTVYLTHVLDRVWRPRAIIVSILTRFNRKL